MKPAPQPGADSLLLGLCREVTAELLAHEMLLSDVQVRGYERVEHGKLEQIGSSVRNYLNAARSINKMLRAGHPDPYDSEADLHQRTSDVLDEAFRSARPLAEPMTVYRGVPGSVPVRPGSVLEDKAFVSTSEDPEIAREFADKAERAARHLGMPAPPPGTRIKVTIPLGSRVIVPREVLGSDPAGEREVLLPRGSRLRVTSASGREAEAVLEPAAR